MTQLSRTAFTCAAQWKMWLFEVLGVMYVIAACAAQDSEDVTLVYNNASPTSPESMAVMITTPYVPPVPILQLQTDWLDVFPTEKVELSCSVTGSSDWTFTWYRNGETVMALPGDGSVLTVIAATEHAGTYTCKGQHKTTSVPTEMSDSLTLTVHANKPKPKLTRTSNFNPMFPGESITFTCMLDVSAGWEYQWYHNGREIPSFNNNTYVMASVIHDNSGQYHCKTKRGKDPFYSEASDTTSLQISDPPTPTLTLQTSWPDVFENEVVEFNCEVSGDEWVYTWYRNKEKLQQDSVLTLDEVDSLLNITSVSQTYQGEYACKAHLATRGVSSGFSNTVTVTVYENVPKPILRKTPDFNSMYVGETVNFTCKVSVSSGWKYLWYKDGVELADTSEAISVFLGPFDQGQYYCKATRREETSSSSTTTSYSEAIQQDVLEIPVPSLKPLTKWLEVFPTERVKFHCEMPSDSGWKYTWYKDTEKVQAGDTVSFDSDGTILFISSASAGHTGKYECKGHLQDRTVSSNSSSQLTLTVYDKKPIIMLSRDPDYTVMFPGELVSFSCNIDVSSEWEYQWYKDGSPFASESKYSLNLTGTTNSGSYKCQAKRGNTEVFTTDFSKAVVLEVKEKKPKPLNSQQPDVDKLYTGESVSFKCEVELSSGWNYHWYKDGVRLPSNSSDFKIADTSLLNNGTYYCKATRDKTTFSTERSDGRSLWISEIPVPALKQVTQWLDVFPNESVKFSCGMQKSSDWTYIWYKDTLKVQADDTVSFDTDGTALSIKSASASHRGKYSCIGKLKSRSVNSNSSSEVTLDVYDTKPRVTLIQNPSYSLMHSGDSVSFGCHVNVSSGWEYLWYKDGHPLYTSGNNHTISSVVTTNTGSYLCQVKRGTSTILHSGQSQAIKLDIKERPQAALILLTGWSEVFSTDSLVLRCEVKDSMDKWNYTWFIEGQPINLPPSEKYTVTPQNDPHQSTYTCQGIRNGRPSYSKSSDTLKTKNLLLKRRVLLSISGVIFFGIIIVFLGCIVFRVVSKPVKDDEKPEEANLFPTMAQLKDFTDAPCPLVEYITDASLNAPSKEGEENGIICSETTPLPITSEEEQAATTDSQGKTESNGGLLSFQQ